MSIFKFVVGMLSPKKEPTNRRPSIGIPVDPMPREALRPHVHRAIDVLGLINPSEEDWVLDIFHANQFGRTEGASLKTRKSPDQMTTKEKRSIGINAKAFMSRSYYARLSEKGRQNPLWALEHTLRMSAFLMYRSRDIANMKKAACTHAKASGPFLDDCIGCQKINGKRFKVEDIPELPAPNCEEPVCAVSFVAEIKV